MKVGSYVREWRIKKDYSQRDLAKILKYHSQQISNVERGAHKRPVEFCRNLFKFLSKKERVELKNLLAKDLLNHIDERLG